MKDPHKMLENIYGDFLWGDRMQHIAILGGDERQIHLAELLREEQYITEHIFGNAPYCEANFRILMHKADTVILPIPLSRDGLTLNAPLCKETILMNHLAPLCRGKNVFAGAVSATTAAAFANEGVEIHDYSQREEFAIMNAVATAEGAVALAMGNTPHTIAGSRCLVVGYGRIGKVLCNMLDSLGAIVSASARKAKDIAWIEANHLHSVATDQIDSVLPDCDIIFNTVPHSVLGPKELACCKNTAIIIELASAPGGIDTTTAGRLGIQVLNGGGLPGKVAPLSAAAYIKETILNICREEKL